MYSKIIQRRWLGIKRPDRDVLNDPGVFGEITMFHSHGGHTRLEVQRHGYTNEAGKLLAPLWDAKCIGKGNNQELWRGYQRTKLPHGLGYTTCIQEWHVEDIALHPPADGECLSKWAGPSWGELPSSIAPLDDEGKKAKPSEAA